MEKLKNFEIEYKRRFFVERIPAGIDLSNFKSRTIKLSYLSKHTDSLEIECESIMDSYFYLNIRDYGLIKRNKIIIQLDDDAAEVINHLSNPKILEIKQYFLDETEKLLLNVYENINNLIIVEYKSNEDDVNNYKPLSWFTREVTNIFGYSNISLSMYRNVKE
jgi:CYTH domain-containing protein